MVKSFRKNIIINNLLMSLSFVLLLSGSVKADFFDFLFGPENCKIGSNYTCNQLENLPYNVFFYSPDKTEKYLGLARNLPTAKIMIVKKILFFKSLAWLKAPAVFRFSLDIIFIIFL